MPSGMHTVSIDRDDDWFIIADRETEVATQGLPILESLLLAEALTPFKNRVADPLGMITDVSTPRNVLKENLDEGR